MNAADPTRREKGMALTTAPLREKGATRKFVFTRGHNCALDGGDRTQNCSLNPEPSTPVDCRFTSLPGGSDGHDAGLDVDDSRHTFRVSLPTPHFLPHHQRPFISSEIISKEGIGYKMLQRFHLSPWRHSHLTITRRMRDVCLAPGHSLQTGISSEMEKKPRFLAQNKFLQPADTFSSRGACRFRAAKRTLRMGYTTARWWHCRTEGVGYGTGRLMTWAAHGTTLFTEEREQRAQGKARERGHGLSSRLATRLKSKRFR